ncbi:hypothetical protein D3P08_10805 [Paenibacillus nanensis]|uniref:Uncharacterized protein n=1 Tax=Paenibacillus nanensis TaxID=393251 RepID=A0A3A1UX65_9BACL|nr:hypothetical protein [Paenibacillus nanensis]RIX53118.1 hypothetical protein D3P08_10805 [Paenibacillus nanensis]
MEFEAAYEKFLKEQREGAEGMRLQRLSGDLTGEKKLLQILWPIFRSFDGFRLEHEIITPSGYKIFIDVFYEPLGLAFECDGFVVHAELISRDRFDMERMRIRRIAACNYVYIPFSWDELDKKPDQCRASVYEILGRLGQTAPSGQLTIYERETLLSMRMIGRPFRMGDVGACLNRKVKTCQQVVRSLIEKKLVKPLYPDRKRNHYYVVDELAVKRLMR